MQITNIKCENKKKVVYCLLFLRSAVYVGHESSNFFGEACRIVGPTLLGRPAVFSKPEAGQRAVPERFSYGGEGINKQERH
jgi:hypothetical protein